MYGILSKNMSQLLKSLAIKAINNNGFKIGALRMQQYHDITKLKFTIEYDIKINGKSKPGSQPFELQFRTGGLFRMLNDDGYNSIFTSLNTQVEQLNIKHKIVTAYLGTVEDINFNKGVQ